MRRLIWTEFRHVQPVLLGVFAIALAADCIWKVGPVLSALWAACIPFVGTYLVRRTNWYLMLPVARTQVMKQVAIQGVCFLLEGLILLWLEFSCSSSIDPMLTQRGLSIFACLVFIATMANPFTGAAIIRRTISPSVLSAVQSRYVLIGVVLIAPLVLSYSWLVIEPVLIWTMIASLFFFWPVLFFTRFKFPMAQSRVVIRRIGAFVVLICLAPVVGSLFLLQIGSPENPLVDTAASFLSRFPAFVSPARALELFSKSQIGDEPSIAKHVETLRLQAPENVWIDRTAKCQHQGCLSLSSDVADPAHLPAEKLARFFTTIMSICKLETQSDGLIRCTGPTLPRKQLDQWLRALVDQGVADQWLNGESLQQQLIALKALPVELNEIRLVRVRALTASPDPLVRNTAIRNLSAHDIVRSAPVDCGKKENSRHEVCRWKQDGGSRNF